MDGAVPVAEKVADPVLGDAAGTGAVGVDVAGVAAATAGEVDVRAGARTADIPVLGPSDERAQGAALSARSRVALSALVARVAEGADGPVGLHWLGLAAVGAGQGPARAAGRAVEFAAAALEAVPEPAAEDADRLEAAVAVAADGGLALGLADTDRFDLLAEVAEPGRGVVADLADRAVTGDGLRRPQLPAADALVLGLWTACLTQAGAVLAAMVRFPSASASGALFKDQRITVVAAAAYRSVFAAGDDVAVLATACAGAKFCSGDAPVAAAAFRGVPGETEAGAVAACAGQLGDGVAVSGGFEVLGGAGRPGAGCAARAR